MGLTDESLARFVGGWLEVTIYNWRDGQTCYQRGRIADARFCDGRINMRFDLELFEETIDEPGPSANWGLSPDEPIQHFSLGCRLAEDLPDGSVSITGMEGCQDLCTIYPPDMEPAWGRPVAP